MQPQFHVEIQGESTVIVGTKIMRPTYHVETQGKSTFVVSTIKNAANISRRNPEKEHLRRRHDQKCGHCITWRTLSGVCHLSVAAENGAATAVVQQW